MNPIIAYTICDDQISEELTGLIFSPKCTENYSAIPFYHDEYLQSHPKSEIRKKYPCPTGRTIFVDEIFIITMIRVHQRKSLNLPSVVRVYLLTPEGEHYYLVYTLWGRKIGKLEVRKLL